MGIQRRAKIKKLLFYLTVQWLNALLEERLCQQKFSEVHRKHSTNLL